jgi:hypothetical protein
MVQGAIRVEGLGELRRALRNAERAEDLRELREGLRRAAGVVARDAQGRVPSRTGRARGSIRPVMSGNRAMVAGGKASVPYYGWLDFGSRNPRTGNPRSVGPWNGSGVGPRQGRFIYPAIDAKSDEVVRLISEALEDALRRLGF